MRPKINGCHEPSRVKRKIGQKNKLKANNNNDRLTAFDPGQPG